ncbi:MAG: hypothetical protein AB7S99_12510 [Pseudodonghicola sp.]
MRSYDAPTTAYMQSRGAWLAHIMIWISATDRESGALEEIGFWTGADHADFTIGGQSRTYYAAGAMLDADPIRLRTGLQVRTQRVRFSQIAPEVQQAIRGYEPRHKPVQIHRALFDPISELLIAEPHLVLRGYVDQLQIKTPVEGGEGSVEMTIATAARALTRKMGRKRSHATLTARAPTDDFRKYASIADKVEVDWGK